jgi:hypothetical protein
MAKHIIDMISPDFDGIPMRLRESCKGQVLLAEDRRENGSLRGLITIDPEALTTKMSDQCSPDSLGELPSQYLAKSLIEYVADDVSGENRTGHKQYAAILAEVLDDPEINTKLQLQGLTAGDINQLKTKLHGAK